MKDKIQAILERELGKLDTRSKSETDPLDIRDVKCLDTLIKAYHSFCTPPESPATQPTSPETQPTDDLVNEIMNERSEAEGNE